MLMFAIHDRRDTVILIMGVISETREAYENFDDEQRRAFIVANSMTIARVPLAAMAAMAHYHDRQLLSGTLGTMSALTDIEGGIARDYEATTPLGGITDPLADKAANFIIESELVRSGELSPLDFAVRFTRDLALSGIRRYALHHGNPNVGARKSGKANTFARMSVNVAALSLTGESHSETITKLQRAVTISTVLSGLDTGIAILRATREATKASKQSA